MIFLIFIVGLLFIGICLFLGYGSGSFGLAYLGMFAMLLMGMMVMYEGIDIDDGIQESPVGSQIFITVWETHTIENDIMVSLIANTFFFIPIAGILLTTFITIRGWRA